MIYFLLLTTYVGCAQKTTSPATPIDITVPIQEDEDCPEAVKVSCNVPDMTETEMNKIYEASQQCVEQCVQNRQAESVSADMIKQECQRGCDAKFFVGQVEVVPELALVED